LEHLGFRVTIGLTDLAEHFGIYLCGMNLICIFVVALLVLFSFRLPKMSMCKENRCVTSIEKTGYIHR